MARNPQQEEQGRKFAQLIAKAWSDEAFKKRLLANPAKILAEEGISSPPGVEVRVVENSDKVVYVVLPPKPAGGEMSVEQLSGVAGGICITSACMGGCSCMTCVSGPFS